MCVKNVCGELRMNQGPRQIRTDSSAAPAMVTRKAVVSVEHLEVRVPLFQEDTQHHAGQPEWRFDAASLRNPNGNVDERTQLGIS